MNNGDKERRRPPWPVIFLLGLAGGVGGTVAAVMEESSRGGWLMLVLVAPAIEEICKPIGLVFMLDKRPHWLRSSAQVISLAILGALVFATLENLLYVHVYHQQAGAGFVIFRYAVCTTLHVTASTVMGVGLAKMWRHIQRRGGHFDIDICFRYYAAAVVIHALYNTTVLVLGWLGLLRF